MKHKMIFILPFFYFAYSNAQVDRNLTRGNKYFEIAYYSEAIPFYKTSLDNRYTYEALKNIADSYYFILNYDKALMYYKYLVKHHSTSLDETTYFRYSETLKTKNKYLEANNMLREYYKRNDVTKLANLEESITYLKNIKANGNRFSIKNLAMNTPESEFGAIQKGDTLIFATPKKKTDGTHKEYGWTGNQYLDLYKVSLKNVSVVSSFSSNINTKLHESNIIFTKDGKTAYFTRNNYANGKRKKDKHAITHLQIFKAQFNNGRWDKITPLSINSDNYSTEHPALSPDEKTLYFASDMPHGFGSFDIYAVAILKDGSMGIPENLGSEINTDKKEQFPYIDSNNNLYFSSNGLPGFGGMDVFISKINDQTISKPDNIGLPINSGYDDFSFNIDYRTKEGYFSSNRTSGKGNDDIYKIKELKPLIIKDCIQYISGVVTDVDTNLKLANVVVNIIQKGDTIEKIKTNLEGSFKFSAACNSDYLVSAKKEKYTEETMFLILKEEREKNNDASFRLKLKSNLEKERKDFLALQQKKMDELRIRKLQQLAFERESKIKAAFKKEKDIVNENGKLFIRTKEINFDYKLWYMRRDSKKNSRVVVNLMNKYPDIIVEIGTHSDMRGNKKYNKDLSQKRANSVRNYIIEQGIHPDRVIAHGYGEEKPIVTCKTEKSCSEEEHELNRRCEFIIIRKGQE